MLKIREQVNASFCYMAVAEDANSETVYNFGASE